MEAACLVVGYLVPDEVEIPGIGGRYGRGKIKRYSAEAEGRRRGGRTVLKAVVGIQILETWSDAIRVDTDKYTKKIETARQTVYDRLGDRFDGEWPGIYFVGQQS